ncbi:hypothetical protein PGT21_022779 [Puccinia graminis f. sp. tritici]|uniref:Uncharacterized protein n=1 Tax=Puccinia graminis f. sp. tritici TaxID=56615 RepID=A0A5B0NWA3_PUCGR|nr:hypothetical protein PGT21_022779 [Puccinia graminis f. sp. tritici]KAA1092350.1 hypothetical protein PGTUg99_022139 [Puccinia graminis f. sp. tritici]
MEEYRAELAKRKEEKRLDQEQARAEKGRKNRRSRGSQTPGGGGSQASHSSQSQSRGGCFASGYPLISGYPLLISAKLPNSAEIKSGYPDISGYPDAKRPPLSQSQLDLNAAFTIEDYELICSYLEVPDNYSKLYGSGNQTDVGPRPLTKTAAYEMFAIYMNSNCNKQYKLTGAQLRQLLD